MVKKLFKFDKVIEAIKQNSYLLKTTKDITLVHLATQSLFFCHFCPV